MLENAWVEVVHPRAALAYVAPHIPADSAFVVLFLDELSAVHSSTMEPLHCAVTAARKGEE